jgi:hypothetical protein
MDDKADFIMIYPGAVLVAAFYILWFVKEFRRRREIRDLVAALSGRLVIVLGFLSEYGVIEDSAGKFRVWRHYPFMNHLTQYFCISRETAFSFKMVATTKKLGLTMDDPFHNIILGFTRIKSDNETLDRRSKAKTNNRPQSQIFLGDPANQEIINYFFDYGFTWMIISPDRITFMKPRYDDSDLDPSLVRRHLRQLAQIKTS